MKTFILGHFIKLKANTGHLVGKERGITILIKWSDQMASFWIVYDTRNYEALALFNKLWTSSEDDHKMLEEWLINFDITQKIIKFQPESSKKLAGWMVPDILSKMKTKKRP